ncbi:gloverin-like [Pectinophora gossypiella]|uniref:gloverin-like n=1 Tax=Pectinophora gossypiella TaxID=13191 RepID=UPI00214DF865|nr:gloverin-like [Pectinophora gossypiella]
MKSFCIFAAVLVAVAAESYPEWYIQQGRYRRDVTLDHKVGTNGRVFGTLGQNDAGLFGRGGYEHNIFDDHRGKLDGQVHGTRVLGPYGDSSHMGGGLNWQNSNAAASLDYNKQIHGPSSFNAAAGGKWPVGKNGDFSLQGTYGKTSGMRHDYGGRGVFNYRW